jgi:hypothetical protein
MTSETKYSFAVSETDIDLLIAEECDCNLKFRVWLLARAGIDWSDGDRVYLLGRSIWNHHGENDLVIVHCSSQGRKIAVLIEDKISATPMELQAERYRVRGEKGINDGSWDSFITMLIAPSEYAAHTRNMVFDKVLSYEDLSAALANDQHNPYAQFKCRLIDIAIGKTRIPWIRTVDPLISEWFKHARDYAISEFPDLPLPSEANGRAPTNKWLSFVVKGFPVSRVCVEIKPHTGHIDLRLNMVDLGELRRIFAGKLPSGSDTVSAKKSSAIRFVRPPLDIKQPLDSQKMKARAIFADADTLRTFAINHQPEFMRLLGY